MKLLLDTHLLLWVAAGSVRLSSPARKLVSDPTNEPTFSVASIWEVALKHAKGLASFQVDPILLRNALFQNGFTEIEVSGRHVVAISNLPVIHKDPFDRLLIAQAMVEGITLLTVDATIAKYPGPIRKV